LKRDHKLVYYLAGIISAFSIFIEKDDKRTDLALYCLPRAIDSLFQVLVKNQRIRGVKYGEGFLFSFSLAIIMYCYEHEPDSLSSFLKSVLSQLLK